MIKKWAMCIHTGPFAHVDCGVWSQGTSSQSGWKHGEDGGGQNKSSLPKMKSSHLDPRPPLSAISFPV